MLRDAIEILAVVTGVFAIATWILAFIYFTLVGIEPMLGRITMAAVVLTAVSIYCMKKGD